jgi:hypothetical protein
MNQALYAHMNNKRKKKKKHQGDSTILYWHQQMGGNFSDATQLGSQAKTTFRASFLDL